MKKEDIVPLMKVRHKRHDITETVIAQCKIRRDDGTWTEGVIYSGKERTTGLYEFFVRSAESFSEDFDVVYIPPVTSKHQ